MAERVYKSTFPDKSNTADNRGKIRNAIERSPLVTSELIGVFVHNVRFYQNGTDLYDAPIPIDVFDQRSLQAMRLASGVRRYTPEKYRAPKDVVTDLGMYVVEHSIIVVGDDASVSLPVVDTDELLRLVS